MAVGVPDSVTVCDVGPRDGLQNLPTVLPVSTRLELIEKLAAAGMPKVEAASFVNPERVPAMAGADEIFAALDQREPVAFPGLILNEKGYERALAAGVREIRFGFSASDEFGLRNQRKDSAEGLASALALVARAHGDGLKIGVTISVAFGCPFSGPVDRGRIADLVGRLMADPPDEISLADTIGVAVPTQVRDLVADVVATGATVNGHFHDTRNTGIANAVAAIEAGAVSLDASVGGAGGCPFAPNATGNIASEDLIYLLQGMGVETGVDLEALIETSHWLGRQLGIELPSMVAKAGIPTIAAPAGDR
jgi:isopropylmalate/homocitrate/citramalate synthase